jgi:drug/metabolite transporter (DMT)-like permease
MYALLSFVLMVIVVIIKSKKEIKSDPVGFFVSLFKILLALGIGFFIIFQAMSFWFYLEETLSPKVMALTVIYSIFFGIPLLIFLLIRFLIWWGKRK